MYIDLNSLECNIIPEKGKFLAYVELGKDKNGKRIRPKVRGRTEDEALMKLRKKLQEMGYAEKEPDAPKLDMIVNQFTPVPDFVREYRVNFIMEQVKLYEEYGQYVKGSSSKNERMGFTSRTAENYLYSLKPFEDYFYNNTLGEIDTSAICSNPNVSETTINRYLQSRAFGNGLLFRFSRGVEELEGIRAALESQIDKQTADEVNYMKEQLAEIAARKDKLLDLYMSDMFSKVQLDERVEPLKAKEERLSFAIKQLSRSNEEVQEDIAAVDETIAYLQEQRELWRKKFKTISREEKIAGLESITVKPDGTLAFKFKGIEEVDRLVEKHKYLKYQTRNKVS